MKAFAVLCVFALAALCAAEDGPFVVTLKSRCDTVLEGLTINNGVETKSFEKKHGEFSFLEEVDGTGIVRPDINTSGNKYAHFYAVKNGQCYENKVSYKTMFVFEHREETTYNKHKCFRYFNTTDSCAYIDKDGVIWGTYYVED